MSFPDRLKEHESRNKLFHHSFFEYAKSGNFSMDDAQVMLGQYWHPLHYFPTFLASLIAHSTDTPFKTWIADILNEELGEGDVDRAHENFYINDLTALGFQKEHLTDARPLESTERLMDCYRRGTDNMLEGLGGLYATESTDLAIVSGIGKLIRAATGNKDPIGWIDIHISQEPNHVEQTDKTVVALSSYEEEIVLKHADEMWRGWIGFFDELQDRLTA